MLRLFLALCALGGCSFVGISYARRLKKRVIALGQLQLGLIQIENLVLSLRRPMDRVRDKLSQEEGLFSEVLSQGDIRAVDYLNKEDNEIINRLFCVLGTGYLDTQRDSIVYAKKCTAQNLDAAQKDLQINGRVYKSLGICAGLFLAILIL